MCLEDRDYVSKMDEKENIKAQYYWSYENQPPKKKNHAKRKVHVGKLVKP